MHKSTEEGIERITRRKKTKISQLDSIEEEVNNSSLEASVKGMIGKVIFNLRDEVDREYQENMKVVISKYFHSLGTF